jgi:hypothetical protein
MKKVLIILGILVMSLGFSADSKAITTFFDFEDGKDMAGPLGGLDAYLTGKFGSQVNVVPIPDTSTPSVGWFGKEDSLFQKSDIIFSLAAGGTMDFDPGIIPSALKITQISFTWGVFRSQSDVDFGLDVFDHVSNRWISNVFLITDSGIHTGDSGPIIFDSSLKVTKIRFHDQNAHDVGLDNLTIVDNRAPEISLMSISVPEASIMILMSSGLLGLWGFRRRFRK